MAEAQEVFEVTPDEVPGSAGVKARGEDTGVRDIAAALAPIGIASPEPVPAELVEQKKASATAADTAATESFGIVRGDLNRLHRIIDAEGVGPDELPLWNAEQERRKYEYDPVEAFGSIGSVFATIASAFTRRPMINALNASAAAMEATKEAKKEDYTRAYQAWKDNTNLVLKRHQMMHQQYSDAADLSTRDLAMGKLQIEEIARKFDDKATIYFMEHGMWKEWLDAQAAQATAATKLGEAQAAMAERLQKTYDLNERLQQPGVARQDVPRIVREWHRDWETQGYRSTEDQLLQDFRRDWADAHEGKPPPAEEEAKFLQTVPHGRYGAGTGTGVLTPGRDEAAEIKRRREKYIAEGVDPKTAYDRATKEVKAANATITGNRREQLEAHVRQYDNAVAAIDKVTGVLERYVGAAGVAGRLTRVGERVGNIFGNNQTDRVQFMRDVEYIKALAPNLLLDRSGRPLSAEAAHINDIVAGLSAGDTTRNTMRAMKDLKVLLKKMRTDQQKRIGEEPAEPETPAGATPDSGSSKNWYEHYQ